MKINTNGWNRIRYTLYTPGYNLIGRRFNSSRKKSIESLMLNPGDKVLLIGAGTGLDIEFISCNCEIIATDITPSMIDRIKRNIKNNGQNVQAMVMDGQCLEFPDNSFDAIILHLILAVIPDPVKCMQEVNRVLKPGGQVAIYDKFLPKNTNVTWFRKLVNVFTNVLITDITRNFESLLDNGYFTVLSDENAGFNGNFRLIRII